MTINNSTLIKSAAQNAATAAKDKFNLVNGGDVIAKNKHLRTSLNDFINRIALAENDNGQQAFNADAREYALGHVLILSHQDNDQLSIEFNICDTEVEYSIQISAHMKKDNEYCYRTTDMEAFEAVVRWAASIAPDTVNDMNGIIEQFFADRNAQELQAQTIIDGAHP